ncbi:MAG: M20/M25/M40 family metallo-hydrolase, partial [Oscillospiraceae bacterium]|nr:M20/M25/M40 family metallo-hydrolase [Oscillospiraceae bacterium]
MYYVGMALLVLVGVLLLLLAVAVIRTLTLPHKTAGYQMSQDEARKALYAEKLSKMVQVETVSVKGKSEPEKFRKMHAQMEALFPTVFSTCEKIEIDGNLMMKWKGRTDKEPLLLMSHIDVVEATGEWKHGPFSGDIAEGKVWGRGTADTKGSVM